MAMTVQWPAVCHANIMDTKIWYQRGTLSRSGCTSSLFYMIPFAEPMLTVFMLRVGELFSCM